MIKSFNLIASLTSQVSYGIVAHNLNVALQDLGFLPTLWSVGGNIDYDGDFPYYGDALQKGLKLQDSFDNNAPTLRIFHQNALAERVGRGELIGMPIFELEKFNKREIHHLSNCDRLVVCSEWASHVVFNQIGRDTTVVPLGVRSDIFRFTPVFSEGPTVFMNVAKWEHRKGHDLLHKAFRAAFTPSDNVFLHMVPTNIFSKEINAYYQNEYRGLLGDQVKFLPRIGTKELVREMNRADCFVFPSRAEGWNLPALEALSLGRHVIATDYSAHTEFLDGNNSLLIPIDTLEVASDGMWFRPELTEGGRWAHLGEDQFDCLVEHMRSIHRLKQMGSLEINTAGIETAAKFSWQNSAKKLLEIL